MKRILLSIIILGAIHTAFGQQLVCPQDTVHFYQTGYRGVLSWQSSTNGTDWTTLEGENSDTLTLVANGEAYFRSMVVEGSCNPYYSEAVHLTLTAPPVVTLILDKDSVCLNESAFILSGGHPAGGSFWGDGIIDNKFIPSVAGIGTHQVNYRYADSLSGCSNTAFAPITVVASTDQASAGSDLPAIAADSVMLDANIPVNGKGTWSIVSGTNGHFSDIHSAKSWFVKESINEDFVLRWTIEGFCGSSSDDIALTFFPVSSHPCPGAPTVTDADGNVYPTVQIGNQCWMARNLNVGRFVSSTETSENHSDVSNNGIIEKYCLFNSPDSCRLYGGLYDWDEAMNYTEEAGTQGICPEGWHIPTVAEWNALDALYPWGQAGTQIKPGGSSGFDGYYAGDRHSMGAFYSNGSSGFFWVSEMYIYNTTVDPYIREIAACNGIITTSHFNRKTGVSVRCIKN
jgi:uncharacterized protein (TIGR02145 family)